MQENFEAEHTVASYSSTYEGVFSKTPNGLYNKI